MMNVYANLTFLWCFKNQDPFFGTCLPAFMILLLCCVHLSCWGLVILADLRLLVIVTSV